MAQQHARKRRRVTRLYSHDSVSDEEGQIAGIQEVLSTALHTRVPPLPADQAHSFGDAEDTEDSLTLPSDTLAALQLLKAQYPRTAQASCPILFRSQVYSLVNDHTAVDQELNTLRLQNTVRLFKLPASIDDYACSFTQDYLACTQALKQGAVPADEQPGSTRQTHSEAKHDELRQCALEWYANGVIPRCTEVQIAQTELLRLMGIQGRKDGVEVTHAHVQALLACGLLVRNNTAGFNFTVPGAGQVINAVTAVRKELLALLRRRRYPEIPLRELEKRKLQSSQMGMQFHLRDLTGRDLVKVLNTTAGKMVQLVRHGR